MLDTGTTIRTLAGSLVWAGLMAFIGPDWWQKPESPLLLGMLVLLPVGLKMARQGEDTSHMYRTAQYLQPFAAVIAGSSYLVPSGVLAGTLAISWLPAMALPAIDVIRHRRTRPAGQVEDALISAAMGYLLIGAVFIWIERSAASPMPAALTSALHFHFMGFGGLLLGGLSGQVFRHERRTGLLLSLRLLAVLLFLAPLPAIWPVPLPPGLRIAAGGIQAAAIIGLSALLLLAALRIPTRRLTRLLLLVSAFSGLIASSAGGAAAAGAVNRAFYLSGSAMAVLHYWPFAVGFSLCGLAAWALHRNPR